MLKTLLTRSTHYLVISILTLLLVVGRGAIAQTFSPMADTSMGSACSVIEGTYSLQQARNLYESGCYSSAVTVLNTLITDKDNLTASVALSNLSLAYQQLGQWDAAREAVDNALTKLELVDTSRNPAAVQAQTLDVKGQLQLSLGERAEAAYSWKLSSELYGRMNDVNRAAFSQIKQAQALQSLGLFHQVRGILLNVRCSLKEQPASEAKAVGLQKLADALWMTGNIEIAVPKTNLCQSDEPDQIIQVESLLEESKAIATSEPLMRQDLAAAAELSLGNFYRRQFLSEINPKSDTATGYLFDSLAFYFQATQKSSESSVHIRALLNLFGLRVTATETLDELNNLGYLTTLHTSTGSAKEALQQPLSSLYEEIKEQINHLGTGQQAVYSYVGLAENVARWKPDEDGWAEAFALLAEAEDQAHQIEDRRSLSYVLGTQGKLYELQYNQEDRDTLDLAADKTTRALSKSNAIDARDISYQWEWQLGRILKHRGDNNGAVTAYTNSFRSLQNLRTDLIASNIDQRFSFRDDIEPIYRDLVELLLPDESSDDEYHTAKTDNSSAFYKSSQADLDLAREVMDALQVAELENFFQAACLDTKDRISDALQSGDAGVYPIILRNHLEVLLQLKQVSSDGKSSYVIKRYSSSVSKDELEALLTRMNDNFSEVTLGERTALKKDSEILYNYLFKATEVNAEANPSTLEAELQKNNLKTLVFVSDGLLRTIPLGALFDGNKYLIDRYAIALNLGIEVRKSEKLPTGSDMNVLAAGLITAPQYENKKLLNVTEELDMIASKGVSMSRLEEERFTEDSFKDKLNNGSYHVVHLATHGRFSSKREETYIMASDGKVDFTSMTGLFRQTQAVQKPVELIVFTACRTAAGDNRAVLGIAGATVEAGARSSIASLWELADSKSPEFADKLYSHLGNSEMNRAIALQQAQIDMKEKYPDYPSYWAPYVLIGSWR